MFFEGKEKVDLHGHTFHDHTRNVKVYKKQGFQRRGMHSKKLVFFEFLSWCREVVVE